MEISKTLKGDELTIKVKGELNTLTSVDLERELKTSLDGVATLIFDFAGLNYITSAGLRVLHATLNVMEEQGKMLVKNVKPEVKEVFDITSFSDFLTFI